MKLPDKNVSESENSRRRRLRADPSGWWMIAFGVCVLWTVAVVIWLSPSRLVAAQASAQVGSVLNTMATLSGAAIVLTLTAILVGLQLLSRFGSRASRTVTTRLVAVLLAVAAFMGVAFPLWAAAEPWRWLQTAAFACFAWTILALGVASSRVLAHLNPRWLAIRQIESLYRFLRPEIETHDDRLNISLSVLLEITDGISEGDIDGHVARRAIAYVGLVGYRLTGDGDWLSVLVEILGARAVSASRQGNSPLATAKVLSLIGVVSDDSDISISALLQLSDLAKDAIAQRREPIVRALLDEAGAFATDRLQSLLEAASITWLTNQSPITSRTKFRIVAPDPGAPSGTKHLKSRTPDADRGTVVAWIDNTTAPDRSDAKNVAEILPPPRDLVLAEHTEAEVSEVDPTLVEPNALGISGDTDLDDPSDDKKPIVIADLADYLRNCPTTAITKSNTSKDQSSDVEWQATHASRKRGSDAYDLLEAIVDTLAAACAAPNPDDHGWPGGWRGSGAFAVDIARLAAPSLALYKSGRYPPTDRTEAAIEDFVSQLVWVGGPDAQRHEPEDPIGWRVPGATIRPKVATEATTALRDLAIEAWQAGFDRRALLTIRRLVALFTLAVDMGDSERAVELAKSLQVAVIRTAAWSSDSIGERWRSRQLVLALAPELSTLARAVDQRHDDAMWKTVFEVLDTIGWSPLGSVSEAAAEVYLYFSAGMAINPNEPYSGRHWDVVSWSHHPISLPPELPDHLRCQMFNELKISVTLSEPRLAILAILALWRDAILGCTPERAEALRSVLQEQILDHGRRSFELDEPWDSGTPRKDRAPRFNQPLVHWRVYDVALAATKWISESVVDRRATKPVLPAVLTCDRGLLELIHHQGARALVDERDYWGVEYSQGNLVLIQEADRSRRLLRDTECRARAQFTWGYGGSGPSYLADLLVADALGPLAYCPSCFGTIGAAGGLIDCPACDDGMRPEVWEMRSACNWLTSRLARATDGLRMIADAPLGAQWHLRRTDLLNFLMCKVTELSAEDGPDDESYRDSDGLR